MSFQFDRWFSQLHPVSFPFALIILICISGEFDGNNAKLGPITCLNTLSPC
jgi:hypothetical protein